MYQPSVKLIDVRLASYMRNEPHLNHESATQWPDFQEYKNRGRNE